MLSWNSHSLSLHGLADQQHSTPVFALGSDVEPASFQPRMRLPSLLYLTMSPLGGSQEGKGPGDLRPCLDDARVYKGSRAATPGRASLAKPRGL